MCKKQGSLSINSENIFPIIKKWLYSDHDIFFRELISNGCDAVTKLKKLEGMGEYTFPEDVQQKVDVILDEEAKTLRFLDTGLGMTADEVDEYINQIAFSGATAFLEQYKDKTNEDQIIGHFGLGFYSAFMVADRVTIDTLSYKEGAEPVFWECSGGTDYTMSEGTRKQVGTEITLYLNAESEEFAKEYRAREIISKYCSFMPVEIYLYTKAEWEKAQEEASVETVETEPADGEKEGEEQKEEKKAPKSLSDTNPLWTKHPNDCTEEEYKEFYRKVFFDFKEPLFWIHLNMDYPFNLKGILYFPKINTEYDSLEGTIKLYNNRVFIADNIKEVIPEFLMLLKGVIDCPDLPLNVSRSALQNDGFVRKVSDYITKKVADKLTGMCNAERESYEKYWDDIHPFIKFGCLKDDKFYEKMKNSILFKNLDGKYQTFADLTEGDQKKIVYVTDEQQQGQYIKMYREAGLGAVILPTNIDSPFITMLEQKNEGVKFARIDAEVTDSFKAEGTEKTEEEQKAETEELTKIFQDALGKEKLTVKVENLKDEKLSAMITLSEEARRMQEMMKMYGMGDMAGGTDETLVLNASNPLVQYVRANKESEQVPMICKQLYDLARISHAPLTPEEMSEFVSRSNEILMFLTK
ncbi:molecular chaperone HtpG [Hominifimenecus sp. rT4P-3]|uniref:molecular chaperone HtpG n=1 Tax=Hominifimenecus sp. rT4P-3 TaxID=3242979 RepID=UPI003DA4A440